MLAFFIALSSALAMVHTPARAVLFSRSIESSPRSKRVDIIAGYSRLGSVFHVAAMVITLTFAIRHYSTFYALAAPYFCVSSYGPHTLPRGGGPVV